MTAPIVIVGAGVAGLALGLALKRHGIDACVYERRPALTVEGVGIQIGPNGTHCLRALGVFDRVQTAASLPEAIVVHDGATGRVLTQLPLGTWLAERHGAPYWVVHRRDLVQALYTAARSAGVEIRFGIEVAGIQETAAGFAVSTTDGASLPARAVIGADGVWSRVRADVFGGADAVPTGKVAARALLAGTTMPDIRRDVVSVWMAPDTHLVCYPVQRGEALNLVLISPGDDMSARWSLPVEADEMRRRFKALPGPVRALADSVETWQQWPLVTRAPLSSYARGRVALVGDAAHSMLPFLAQGAVMALEDALTLATCLTARDGNMPAALTAYSDDRLARTQRVALTAAQQGRIYHLAGPMRMARNAVLQLAPPTLLMRRYDWLYGFKPEKSPTNPG